MPYHLAIAHRCNECYYIRCCLFGQALFSKNFIFFKFSEKVPDLHRFLSPVSFLFSIILYHFLYCRFLRRFGNPFSRDPLSLFPPYCFSRQNQSQNRFLFPVFEAASTAAACLHLRLYLHLCLCLHLYLHLYQHLRPQFPCFSHLHPLLHPQSPFICF